MADQAMQMIEDCEARQSKLSEWEAGFIDSVSRRLADRGSLTSRQLELLHEIWDRATEDG